MMKSSSITLAVTIGGTLLAFLLTGLWSFVGGVLVMLLWNAIIPDIFGLPTLTYLQACGLYFLSILLFKNNTQSKKSEK